MMRRAVSNVRLLLLVFVATLAAVWPVAAQAAAPGPAAGFALLSAAPGGGGAVTCTTSTVNGNVGSSGAAASVANTGCTMGTVTAPVSAQVLADFTATYGALKLVPCNHTLTTLDLTQSLAPGVYCFPAAATATGKVLTLNGPANGIWLFKIGTGGTGALTGTDFSVIMAGGGQPCNVNWWVAQAATLTVDNGASTPFQGNILAGAAATATGTVGAPTALTLTGRVWAGAGVTVKNSTIVGCASAITVPKTKCKSGTSNDEDKDSDKSKDATDGHESVKSASRGDSDRSHDDGKDDGDHGSKGCDSDSSHHGDKDRSKD
jgi:hypothetical protein